MLSTRFTSTRQILAKWRRSIDVDHISPERGRSVARFYDETPFEVTEDQVNEEITKIREFITEQSSLRRRLG